ncbi:Integrase, catalytic core [Metarhizium brunneum]
MDNTVSGLQKITKLESPDQYIEWNRQITDFLSTHNYGRLFNALKEPPVKLQSDTEREYANVLERWEEKQDNACNCVRATLGYNAREIVKPTTDKPFNRLHEVLETIEENYKPTGSANYQEMDRNYHELSLENCEGVMNFASKLQEANNQLLAINSTLGYNTPQLVNKFLIGLGDNFSAFRTTFYQTHQLIPEMDKKGKIKTPGVSWGTTIREAQHFEKNQKAEEQAKVSLLAMKRRQDDREKCNYCKRLGHGEDRCWKLHPELRPKRPRTNDRQKASELSSQDKQKEEIAGIPAESEIGTLFARLSLATTPSSKVQRTLESLSKTDIFDSGTSQHTFMSKENFMSLRPYLGDGVLGVGGKITYPKAIGTYKVLTFVNGKHGFALLKDSLWNPEAGVNLISISQLTAQGMKVEFCADFAAAWSGKELRMIATQRSGLYFLDQDRDSNIISAACAAYSISDPALQIWHGRLAHLSEQGIKQLMDMSTGIKPIQRTCLCKGCALGRLKQVPHKGKIRKGTRPLEYIHADISGPFHIEGYSRERYWAVFIDDFTQYAWVFPIKHRSDFLSCFKSVLDTAERPERRCYNLHIDKAGENISTEVQAFCKDRGIALSATATEQHEQNGIAERLNGVILERLTEVLANIDDEEVPSRYWPILLQSVMYLRNRSPSSVIGKTPYEGWFGQSPDLAHLRTLGAKGFVGLKRSGHRKLDPVSEPCRMLGYQGSTNYIVLTDSGVNVSNNVIFDEHQTCLHRTLHAEGEAEEVPAETGSAASGSSETILDTIILDTWNDDAVKAAWSESTPAAQKPYVVYAASKTEGERAAWNWMRANKPHFVMNTVLPSVNYGRVLSPQMTASTMGLTRRLLQGDKTVLHILPPQWYVDVQDTARLHVIALLDPAVRDERLFAFAGPHNWTEVIQVFHRLCPQSKLPPAPENEGRDLSDVKPAKRAEQLLRDFFGLPGWTSLKDSLADGIDGFGESDAPGP